MSGNHAEQSCTIAWHNMFEGGEDAFATFLSRCKVSLCLRALKCSFEMLKVQAFLKIKRLHKSMFHTLLCHVQGVLQQRAVCL